MRRSVALVLLGALATLLPAGAALAGVAYEVAIQSPSGVARGSTVVRARISGGVRHVESAAYHVRSAGGWIDGESVPMQRVAENVFEAPWSTSGLPNDVYRLEVRAWGELPQYDPQDPNSYASQVVEVAVDNAPPAPARLTTGPSGPAVRIGWEPVPTSDRNDFLGYRVLGRRGPCTAHASSYREVATVEGTVYASASTASGRWCFRVVALRSSVPDGVIASVLSPGIAVEVTRRSSAGELVTGSAGPPVPPPPPPLGDGLVRVSDGSYEQGLPYGPRTIVQGAESEAPRAEEARESGVDPRRTATLIAAGLILAIGAMLIRRFLSAGPGR